MKRFSNAAAVALSVVLLTVPGWAHLPFYDFLLGPATPISISAGVARNGNYKETRTDDSAPAANLLKETMGTTCSTSPIGAYTGFTYAGTYTYAGTGDVRSTSPSGGYDGASAACNVFLTNTTAPRTFQIAGIDTTGYTNLTISFGIFKSTTASTGADLVIEVSADGVNYAPLTYTALPSGAGTANVWNLRTTSGAIPSTANLRIRFSNTGTATQYRIDDVSLDGTPAPSAPNLAINDVSKDEGNAGTTAYTFTVSLSTANHGGVTFDIATADNTATTAADDYTAVSLTGQTIPNGTQFYQFTVQVNGDTIFEPDQRFFVNVTNVAGAAVTDGQGQGVLVNDDAPPQFSIADAGVFEGDAGATNLNFTVTKTGATETGATVQAMTADDTANAGSDYAANTQTLTFGPNETEKTFTVVINGDTQTEPEEYFFVNLSNPTDATITDNQAEGAIFNDDVASATVEFASTNYADDESQTAIIIVTRSGALSQTTTVNYSTQPPAPPRGVQPQAAGGGACTSGVDFIHASGTLVFGIDQETAEIQLQLCGDLSVEPEEVFKVYLSNVQNGVLGDISTAQVFINDTASQFSNPAPIFIGTGGDSYDSSIEVTGIPANIGGLRVTLYDFEHLTADDIDVLLVGPQGQKFLLMGDAGGEDGLVEDSTITFDDNAGQVLPDNDEISTGRYEPTTWQPGQTNFPAPAPAGPYTEPGNTVGGAVTLASVFAGTNANGTWTLYIRDDTSGFQRVGADGVVAGGWGIQFFAPTAAGVSVSGFVHSGKMPIANATVMVTGGGLTEPLMTRTNNFGLYRFEGLPVGQTYVVTVISKRYTFADPSRVINLTDSVTDENFVADSQ